MEQGSTDAELEKELASLKTGAQGHQTNLDAGKQPQQTSSGAGNYQNYIKQYAGNYAGNYQKYMTMQNNKECKEEIGSASDAKTKDQLNKWYSVAKVHVKCYVPEEDASFADSDVRKQYEKRLQELDSTTESPIEASEELVEKP